MPEGFLDQLSTVTTTSTSGSNIAYAEISSISGSSVYVVAPRLAGRDYDHGPIPWSYSAPPTVGDKVLVAFDDSGKAWITAWEGVEPASITLPITESSVTGLVEDLAGKAPLLSPALTGTPTAPTAAAGTNTTQLATTAFVHAAIAAVSVPVSSVFGRTGAVVAVTGDYGVSQVTGAAPLASPGLTGTPTAPTAAAGTNTAQIATTAFVTASFATTASVTTAVNTALAIPSLRLEADAFLAATAAGSYVVDFNGGIAPSGGATGDIQAIFAYNSSLDDPPAGYKTQWNLVITYQTNATSPAKTLTWAMWELVTSAGGAGGISNTMSGGFGSVSVAAALTANNKGSVSTGWSDTNVVGAIVSGKFYLPAVSVPTGGMAASSACSFMMRLYRRWVPV